jgi:hypothetical protein
MVGARLMGGNPYDSHTLADVLAMPAISERRQSAYGSGTS